MTLLYISLGDTKSSWWAGGVQAVAGSQHDSTPPAAVASVAGSSSPLHCQIAGCAADMTHQSTYVPHLTRSQRGVCPLREFKEWRHGELQREPTPVRARR